MLTELQWNDLIRSLENEKCILILGTETLVDVQGKAILPQFLDDVGYPNSPQIRFFDNDFFFYKDEISKRLINGELQDFLKKQSSPSYFDDLAKIPFHLILNLNPDLRLRSSFENQGFELVFDHYHKNKPCAPLDEKPNKNKPLIYNLMGKIEEDDSLVFTQEDTFDYLISILGDFRLSNLLEKELILAKNIVFLGVPLQKWYMKMLMKLLKVNFGMALNNDDQDLNTQFFCENRNITLVQGNVKDFVENLLTKCQNKGIALRQKSDQNQEKEIDKIAKMITNDLAESLQALIDYLENKDEDLCNDVMLQLASYNQLQKKIAKNTIDQRDAAVAEAKILDASLAIIKEAKKL